MEIKMVLWALGLLDGAVSESGSEFIIGLLLYSSSFSASMNPRSLLFSVLTLNVHSLILPVHSLSIITSQILNCYLLHILCISCIYNFKCMPWIHEIPSDIHLLISRADAIWGLESTPLQAKVFDCRDNCLRVSLRAPILPSDSVVFEHKMDCAVDSFVSDHELLIELGEGIMELKKVQVTL